MAQLGSSKVFGNLQVTGNIIAGTTITASTFSGTLSGGVIASTQIVTIAGTSTNPAIAPTGDSNNGIFFPATDNIALTTAGSERIRLTSTGNLGIGTTAPNSPLHVNGIITLTGSAGSPVGNQSYVFQNSSTTADFGLCLRHYNSSIKDAEITVGGSNSFGTIYMLTNTAGATATERMTITPTGNVGIGTVSPNTRLEVTGSASFSGAITSTLAQGTAPFTVGSSTLVSNLNVQYLNGIASTGFVATSNGTLLNPSLTRVDSSQEGGQLNFNRPSDDTMYWALDTYGTSTAPSFRLLETTNTRLQIDPGGVVLFNGSAGSSGQVLKSQGTAAAPIWSSVGSGTVTSIAATVPSILTISGSPITSSGTLAIDLATQGANLIFAGPISGVSATPIFRSLVASDIPNLGTSYLTLTGGTISGDLVVTGKMSQGSTLSVTGLYASAFGSSLYSGGTASFVQGISNAAMSEASHVEGKFGLGVYGAQYTITATDNVNKAVVLSSTAGLTPGDTLNFYVYNGAPVTGITIASIAGSTVFLSGSPNITSFWNMAVERASSQFALHVEGHNNLATGSGAHAEGYQTKAIGGFGAHSEGNVSVASGDSSHAEGDTTTASNQGSHSEGFQTTASGFAGHSEGQSSTASGDTSHAQGYATVAGGWVAHAEGDCTGAITDRTHSQGVNTFSAQGLLYTITAFDNVAKTITLDSTAGITVNNLLEIKRGNGQVSAVLGVTISAIAGNVVTLNTTQTINSSWLHAVKKVTNGIGGQHSEGAYSIATGVAAHAQNNYTIASGDNSHSGGLGTIAQGYNQTVIGKYNIAQGTTSSLSNTDYAFIVGNGTSTTSRSNAFVLDWNGGATFAKDIVVNGVNIGRNNDLYSTRIGKDALRANTNGSSNTAVGNATLYQNTTGFENTAVGDNALGQNVVGRDNTAIGYLSMATGATGNYNTALGSVSLYAVSNGQYNIGIGYAAGQNITTGSNNTVIGSLNGSATLSNTVLIGAGTTERLKVDSTGLYVNQSTNNLNDALAIAWLGL